MASVFIKALHDGVEHMQGNEWLFYYGVKPHKVHKLPVGAEFSIIYTFGWKAVRYQILAKGPGQTRLFTVVKDRSLEPDEIEHFKGQVAGL